MINEKTKLILVHNGKLAIEILNKIIGNNCWRNRVINCTNNFEKSLVPAKQIKEIFQTNWIFKVHIPIDLF